MAEEVKDFTTPETGVAVVEKKEKRKFLGLTGKQWAGIGLTTVGTFLTGFITGQKTGIKRGYAVGRGVGAIINNCPEDEATRVIGTDANRLKAEDTRYLQTLREAGKIK